MLLFILRIILLYWIITVVVKWLAGNISSQKPPQNVSGTERNGSLKTNIKHTGTIDDAEFEEIEDK